MEPHSFASLRDMLKAPSPTKPILINPKSSSPSWTHTDSSTNIACVANILEALSVKESPLLSSLDSSLDAPLSFSSVSETSLDDLLLEIENTRLNEINAVENYEENPKEGKEGGEIHSLEENCQTDFGKTGKSQGTFPPPPISCLKLFKTGKPYAYLNFNEDDDTFALEEVRIPDGDILRAAREGGSLKLYFGHSADDEFSGAEEDKKERKSSN